MRYKSDTHLRTPLARIHQNIVIVGCWKRGRLPLQTVRLRYEFKEPTAPQSNAVLRCQSQESYFYNIVEEGSSLCLTDSSVLFSCKLIERAYSVCIQLTSLRMPHSTRIDVIKCCSSPLNLQAETLEVEIDYVGEAPKLDESDPNYQYFNAIFNAFKVSRCAIYLFLSSELLRYVVFPALD